MNKLNIALVLVAVFATAHGGGKMWKACFEKVGLEKEEFHEGMDQPNFWCSTEKKQKMADCVTEQSGSWDGENLDTEAAVAKAEQFMKDDEKKPEKIKLMRECFDEGQKEETHLKCCKAMDCFKDKGGFKKQSKRSIFFV